MNKSYLKQLLPVLFGFFIMGFCDIVGISTSYVKSDFNLSETMAGFIPSMVFLWFLLLSVPCAMLMNRIGRKRMVQLSNIVTICGMIIPIIEYNFITCMVAFLLLGVGNTILQVSLNPLLTNVVSGKALTSSLTAGQVVKAVSSFCGPIICAFAAHSLGSWKMMFPIYALITILSAIWLQLTHIVEEPAEQTSSLKSTLALLGNRVICLLFLGIFFIVGIDVGINTLAPKLLIERCDMAIEQAGYACSVYFICRTIGAFIGTILLARVNSSIYFVVNMIGTLCVFAALFMITGLTPILLCVGLIGFLCSSIFSVIYSYALKANPKKENEISGIMIMGIFGGAVIPPVMGYFTDLLQSQAGSIAVLTCCVVYLLFCSLYLTFKKSLAE